MFYVQKWLKNLNFSPEIIKLAYLKCDHSGSVRVHSAKNVIWVGAQIR